MDKIKVVFTNTPISPISWIIRWALPRTRFSLSKSSHCYMVFDNTVYETLPFKGVMSRDISQIDKTDKIVNIVEYEVPNKEAGLQFLKSQLGKGYDLKGAFGIALTPDRNWEEDDKWFCYELAAATLKAAGRDEFNNISHVNEVALWAIKPNFT